MRVPPLPISVEASSNVAAALPPSTMRCAQPMIDWRADLISVAGVSSVSSPRPTTMAHSGRGICNGLSLLRALRNIWNAPGPSG